MRTATISCTQIWPLENWTNWSKPYFIVINILNNHCTFYSHTNQLILILHIIQESLIDGRLTTANSSEAFVGESGCRWGSSHASFLYGRASQVFNWILENIFIPLLSTIFNCLNLKKNDCWNSNEWSFNSIPLCLYDTRAYSWISRNSCS